MIGPGRSDIYFLTQRCKGSQRAAKKNAEIKLNRLSEMLDISKPKIKFFANLGGPLHLCVEKENHRRSHSFP
jgi:hypothetical protein